MAGERAEGRREVLGEGKGTRGVWGVSRRGYARGEAAARQAGGGGFNSARAATPSAFWQRLKKARLPGGPGCLMGRLEVSQVQLPFSYFIFFYIF